MKGTTFPKTSLFSSTTKRITKKFLLTFLGFAATCLSQAATIFSNNVTGNWSSPASWSTNTVPGVGDIAIIGQGTITVDIVTTAGAVQISGGTLKLNAALTVTNGWEYNSGTFTPNTQTVIFGTGGSIGGTLATTFYNLTINTTNNSDIVPLNKSGIVIANNGTLAITKGIFKVGAGNVINMGTNGSTNITVAGGTTGNFANAADGSGLNTDADGGTINQVPTSGSSIAITGAAVLYNVWCGGGANGNFKLDFKSTGARINGTLTIGSNGGNQFQCITNSPAWGPNSLLYINNNGQQYSPGGGTHLEWVGMASGTIGTTPGYPNNVTLMNCGTSASNYNGNQYGVKLSGSWSMEGIFRVGTPSSSCLIDMNNGGSGVNNFSCGGIIIDNGSKVAGPGLTGSFQVKGNWLRTGGTIGTYINNNGTVTFNGNGTSVSPQAIGIATGTETSIANIVINNGTYVKLNSAVTLPALGILSLTSGILETSAANILNITNPAITGITGTGSATNYINGPIKWSLLTGTNTYVYPMGAGTAYLPITINCTNAQSNNVATVQAFNTGSGGTTDGTLSSLSTTEYWSFSTVSNITSGTVVSVTRPTAIAPLAYIAKSNSAAGIYTSIGGTTGTFGVTNSNDIGATSPWFFTLGAPPIVSTLTPTSITTTGATLQGAFNTQGSSHNTSFTYGTNTSSGLGTPATIHSPINSNTSVLDSAIITGLTANTLYTFKATDGVNSGSDVTFITSPNPPTVGVGTAPTANGFTANWTAPSVLGTAAYTYTVRVSTDPTFATGVTTQTGIASGNTSYTFTNLSTATVYYYEVATVNTSGPSVWSATSNAIATNVIASPPCNNNTSNDGATTFTNAAPVIDGTIDAVWTNAPSNSINVVTLGNNNNTQNWRSLWTGDSLYLLVQVTDASLISQGAGLQGSFVIPGIPQSVSGNYYEADGIEFYLDADYSNGNNYDGVNDVQLRFNLGSTAISGQSAGGVNQFVGAAFQRIAPLINWKMQVVSGGYLLEAAIPWGKDAAHPGAFLYPNNTYGTPTSGQTIGIDVNINDQDNTGGGRQAQIQWFNSSTDAYLHPNVFSNAGLQVCPVAPVVTTPTKTSITATSAVLGATVVSSGKDALLNVSPLTSKGTAYNTTKPVISNAQAEGTTAIGVYTTTRTGLTPQTKYYYEGYANNAAGLTGVSEIDSFYTLSALPTVQPVLTATNCSAITLNWNAITFPPVNEATQTGYLLLRRQDGANPTATGIATRVATKQADLPVGTTLLATINSGATITYTDATAVSGTTYKYLLVPFTWDGVITDSTFNYFVNEAPTVTVTISTPVTPTFNPVPAICSGATLDPLPTISTNNITGTWSPALDNQNTRVYTFAPAANQCATSTTLTITVNQGVTPTFNPVAAICTGSNLNALPTTSTNNIIGTWSPALDNQNTKEYTFTPSPNQCAGIAKLTITVNQPVVPTFNPVAAICAGSNLNALPTTSTNNISGTWSPALDNQNTREYTFTPSANQCATTAKLTITVNQPVVPTFNAVAPICSGGNLNALPTTSTNNISGTWSPALDNQNTKEYTFTPSANQCASVAKLTITVIPLPVVNASADPISPTQGATVTLTGTSSVEGIYAWTSSPSTSIASSGSLTATSNPTEDTRYTLTVTNEGGCTASDDVLVTITPEDCMNVPNVFTPNNDGYYDVWVIFKGQCYKQVTLDVYNRWGGQVYHSDNYDNKWNGTYKGNTLPDATYYYVIKATSANGHTKQFTGNVTIMR
ncbi:gliding motility-associated C-terminal domain-containing protein [Ferruginibacter lapsinanis]|uniref:sugar-binding protein n=1 Tax=Ferruginibacter lapsinanis TaxID=563172 RepID=UPI001E60E275|nr:sugar-binding protein [Ferruginibacter lapsinanis]UEG49090.1 gliding motility-associated C-terminal domain-containing protein [Ferruginibacter lapsinanis]